MTQYKEIQVFKVCEGQPRTMGFHKCQTSNAKQTSRRYNHVSPHY